MNYSGLLLCTLMRMLSVTYNTHTHKQNYIAISAAGVCYFVTFDVYSVDLVLGMYIVYVYMQKMPLAFSQGNHGGACV